MDTSACLSANLLQIIPLSVTLVPSTIVMGIIECDGMWLISSQFMNGKSSTLSRAMVEVLNYLFLLWIGVDCLIYSVCSYHNLPEILVKFSVHEKSQSLHDAIATDVKEESIVGTNLHTGSYGSNGCSVEGAVCYTDN